MPITITIVIKQDPFASHKAVEGLRIALGLSTGNSKIAIILLEKARAILTEDSLDVIDAEILEKHIPVIQDLEIPILVPEGTSRAFTLDQSFNVTEASDLSLQKQITTSDRVLIF